MAAVCSINCIHRLRVNRFARRASSIFIAESEQRSMQVDHVISTNTPESSPLVQASTDEDTF
jgi:hypothetical protein